MKIIKLNLKKIEEYKISLYEEERSQSTINKYIRDIKGLYEFMDNEKVISKEILVSYKQYLLESGYKVTSINSMLVAVNGILDYLGLNKFKLKLYKIQRRVFYEEENELTKEEYKRLLDAALKTDNMRLYMLLQTICGTGIRVSEHKYITVESLSQSKVTVHNKGKVRIILIPKQLKKMLKEYCQKEGIVSGIIFCTKNGKPMDRSNIWNAMKKLCQDANVNQDKVFPHNLRHLFALTYYRLQKDVVRLADLLGHSSIDTTRIYTMTSGRECIRSLAKMDLIVSLC